MLGYDTRALYLEHVRNEHLECPKCDSYFASTDDRAEHQHDESHAIASTTIWPSPRSRASMSTWNTAMTSRALTATDPSRQILHYSST
jgi:hypothetical protein